MKTTRIAFAAAAIVAAVSHASLAAAADLSAPAPVTFAYDLDQSRLQTSADARAVYWDLRRKAGKACTLHGVRGLASRDRACVADLMGKVVASSGSDLLLAEYERSGDRAAAEVKLVASAR